MHCNKCRKVYPHCFCKTPSSIKTTINSEESGREGLSAYDIAVKTGKFTGTEAEFVDWNRGEQGPPGQDGGGAYLTTEW